MKTTIEINKESFELKECYNVAVTYLKNKYGFTLNGLICTASNKLYKERSAEKRKEIEKSFTAKDYIEVINTHLINDVNDLNVKLLIEQYYSSYSVREDLYYLLIDIGVIKEN